MYRRIARKSFFTTLFLTQNNHHRYSVLGHTSKLVWLVLKDGRYDFLAAALLHDVGKPLVAYQDEKDKTTGEYSFTNHEEISYHAIKHWPFVNQTTKSLVRYQNIAKSPLPWGVCQTRKFYRGDAMSTVTLRIPDAKHERLKQYAKEQGISLNKLFDEFATVALAQFDAKTRFEIKASKGSVEKGLKLLDKLDSEIN